MINPFNVRNAGAYAGGQDHFIKVCPHDLSGGRFSVEMHANAAYLQLLFIIADSFVELFFAGDLIGKVQLPADGIVLLEQKYLMTPSGGNSSK